jgi:hypothetical protein
MVDEMLTEEYVEMILRGKKTEVKRHPPREVNF